MAYIPNNELWVMARDTGKFAFFGGLKSKEFMELDNWYWHYLARRDTGIMVHHPERAHLTDRLQPLIQVVDGPPRQSA